MQGIIGEQHWKSGWQQCRTSQPLLQQLILENPTFDLRLKKFKNYSLGTQQKFALAAIIFAITETPSKKPQQCEQMTVNHNKSKYLPTNLHAEKNRFLPVFTRFRKHRYFFNEVHAHAAEGCFYSNCEETKNPKITKKLPNRYGNNLYRAKVFSSCSDQPQFRRKPF